ncbi:MAG: hypothetical protein WCW87_02455 [Candidatus Paceibacterota bacterium]
MIIDVVKVFLPAAIAFFLGIFLTPFWTHYLYKNEMWKKKAGKVAMDGKDTPIFNSLHKDKEVGTPKMGGVIIWLSASFVILGLWILDNLLKTDFIHKLDFLSRSQTWLPFFALLVGAVIGLVDDFLDIRGSRDHISGGLSLKKRIILVSIVGLLASMWFYFKLEISMIYVPFIGTIYLGWLFIPFFIFVMLGIYSGGVIDGLDGLAGGVLGIIFGAYTIIAFFQNQIDLAAFCAVIVGSILAFLWFNIPPARFYMSETGSMALLLTLTVVAFMTDSLGDGHGLSVLPIIAFPLIVTTLSDIIQVVSKKFRNGKKVFLVAPIHHHFEAIGWPAYKVTMRYWIISIIFATIGIIIAFLGK